MDRAEAAAAGSAAGSVLMVLMVVTVLGVHTADLGEPCPGSGWFERDGTGRWSLSSSDEVDTPSQHPAAATHLTWAALKQEAQKLSTELGDALPQDGLPLPMLTCHTPAAPCHYFANPNTPCTRVARRVLCLAVGKACQAVVVITEEPRSCCCGLEEHNTTLTGKVTNMWLRKTCPSSFEGTAGRGGRGGGGGGEAGEAGGLVERRRRREGEPILSSEGSVVPSLHEEPPNVEDHELLDNTTSNGTSERVEGAGEMTEEDVKKSSILEDIIAALVFLFVGGVLVLLKSRLFSFMKKKQQEDRDVESEETLVDETII